MHVAPITFAAKLKPLPVRPRLASMIGSEPEARPTVVLVVEDEPLVRALGVDVLEDAGFVVVEAANATEALRTLETRSDVRVVFTDVNMPGGLDGLELARLIHQRWPQIRLIVASGQATPKPGDIPSDGEFVPKPWEPDALVDRIRELVGQAA